MMDCRLTETHNTACRQELLRQRLVKIARRRAGQETHRLDQLSATFSPLLKLVGVSR
jgi:hypothetical protein